MISRIEVEYDKILSINVVLFTLLDWSRFSSDVLHWEWIGYTEKERTQFWKIYLLRIQFDAALALYQVMWNVKDSKVDIFKADFWC